MSKVKAREVRLIDILNCIYQDEIIHITYEHGRYTYSNTAIMAEIDFDKYLGTQIIGIDCNCGVLTIYI